MTLRESSHRVTESTEGQKRRSRSQGGKNHEGTETTEQTLLHFSVVNLSVMISCIFVFIGDKDKKIGDRKIS
jgi:hypothetical protein